MATVLGGLIAVLSCAAVSAQDAPPIDPTGAAENRVFLVSTQITEEADVFLHQINPRVGRCALISNEFIDPDQNLVPNWDVLENALENICPPDYTGVIVLNWEGPFFHTLKDGPENPNFYIMRQRGINVLNFVKTRRPNALVGYYSLPMGQWNIDQSTLMPLYDVLEVLMPNGVMGQAEPENYPAMVEKMRKNVEYALELPGDRPVLVFHSPRHTHDGCVRVDFDLWASHMIKSFDYEFEGKRAAGVAIWDPTILMFNRGELEAADAEYLTPGLDMWEYITAIEMAYYCTGAKAVVPEAECDVPGDLLGDIADSITFLPPGDGVINAADLAYLLTQWGANAGSMADIVSAGTLQPPPDGIVDAADLSILLGNWTE